MMWILIEIALIAFIGTVMVSQVNLLAKDVTYQRVYVSSDLGLTLNAILGSSANIITRYDSPSVDKFSYKFNRGFITLQYPDASDVGAYFGRDLDVAMLKEDEFVKAPPQPKTLNLLKPYRIHITKTGNSMIVGKLQEQSATVYRRCPIVDAVNVGLVVQGGPKDAVVQGVRFKVSDAQVSLKPKVGPGDAYLTFRTSSKRANVVTAYIRQDARLYKYSYSLGCFIGNAVAHRVDVTSVNVVPISEGDMYYADLNNPGIGAVIELDRGMETTRVGEAIGEGVNVWRS
ncbi:MAG: hypothetical protein ACE5FT_02370 [Candidatus Nanoarchaeia archaeon]